MSHDEAAPSRALGMPEPRTFADTQAAIQRALSGSEGAFSELWRRFVPGLEVMLYGRIWRGLGPSLRGRLVAEIEDILSQVMANAFARLATFESRGPRSFLAWLCKITENVLSNRIAHWTTQGRDARLEAMPSPDSSTGAPTRQLPPADESGPVTAVARDEQRQRVARALASLPERSYTILYWRFFSGASWEEIKELTGAKSADAVRMECFNKALPAFAAALAEA